MAFPREFLPSVCCLYVPVFFLLTTTTYCLRWSLQIFSLDSVGCFRKAEAASAAAMSLILRKDVLIDGVLSSPTWVATNPKLPVFYTADSNLNSSTSLKYSITQSPTGSLEFKASILESCKQAGYRPVCVSSFCFASRTN